MERRGSHLSRRAFVVGAGAGALGLVAGCGRLPFLWQAPPPPDMRRVGLLNVPASSVEYFRQAMRELGYVEGQNVAIEWRSAEGRLERLPNLASELVGLPVDVIVASGDAAIGPAMHATHVIPIVMLATSDPVASGFVASLSRPGGNVTGLTVFGMVLTGKRLELLKAAVPGLSRTAALGNPGSPQFAEAAAAANLLGVELQRLEVRAPEELGRAFETASRERAEAMLVLLTPATVADLPLIAERAAAGRLPAIFGRREFADVGGLMTYGPNIVSQWRRGAVYVDRILKGAKPADLPVEQPMTFDFVVNLKTAQALGITFPDEIMLQVTEVIE